MRPMSVGERALFVLIDQFQRSGIDAIAQAGRFRAIGENVAQMRIAFAAKDLFAHHAVADVAVDLDLGFIEWGVETGPSGAGVEFCL